MFILFVRQPAYNRNSFKVTKPLLDFFSSSANRWRGLPAAHTSRHRQDPVNQVRTRSEDLQLHPHVEERR